MMKLSTLACVICIGIATPVIATATLPTTVMAAPQQPNGLYMDKDWAVFLEFRGGTYHYRGTNNHSGKALELAGASIGGSKTRRTYTWNNAGTLYRITWQPQDPDFVRLQVISPSGKELMNRLLTLEHGC
jgi:hypothetical protein